MAVPTHAQLITDSKAKLKSQKAKKESDGFLFFGKRKGKREETQAKTEKASTPKYSNASIGKRFRNLRSPAPRYSNAAASGKIAGQSSKPRYSGRVNWKGTQIGGVGKTSRPVNWKGAQTGGVGKYSRPVNWKGAQTGGVGKTSRPVNWKGTPSLGAPRYSKAVNWKGASFGGAPRYSRPVNWKGTPSLGAPRYSKPVNWKGASFGGTPRYSQPVNWRGTPSLGAPRYSKPVNWKGASFGNAPRYSQPVNWRGTPSLGAPRYSRPVNWRGTPSLKTPRYSQPVSWKGTPYGGTPRYSQPVSWKGAYFPGKPRYSSFKHRFDVNKRYIQQTRPHDFWVGNYHGTIKYKKPNHKNMHPSVNYLVAKNIPIKLVRKGLRSWNVFWVRINDSKITPKGTRKFAKKPKFDKKERDIWNNDRENKPTTRQDATAQAEPEIPDAEKEEGNQ